VRTKTTWAYGVAALAAIAIVIVMITGSSDTKGGSAGGGTLVDGGTLTYVPANIDPALVNEVEAMRITNALYDGLTEFDFSGTQPELKGLLAESWTSSDDATQWTFTIKERKTFSNGESVLPSSFKRGWERAADPELEAYFGFLFGSIETITADDDAMTLTVDLTDPNPEFAALVSHLAFSPMPVAVEALDDPAAWDQGAMVGNGPFVLETPRNDREIVVVRNDEWGGDIFGNTRAKLDRIEFRISRDVDAAWQAFLAGETQTTVIPPAQLANATLEYGNTVKPQLATYFFGFGMNDPVVGGDENVKLRQAISLAIDREQVNDLVFGGTRVSAGGYTPPGVPGYEADLCELVCTHDAERARALFQEWVDEGHELSEPIKVQYNTDQGHENVIAVIVDGLNEAGISAEGDPRSDDTYIDEMFEGGCQVCRLNWQYDYPSYENGFGDLFTSEGFSNITAVADPDIDALVAEARTTLDDADRWDLYRQAESRLLNEITAIAPLNYYNGDNAYSDDVTGFTQTPLGLVPYEVVDVE
jgi:ABC-type oligopeptide transport system substrate-binding subunit